MKKIYLIFILAVSVFAFSCKSDVRKGEGWLRVNVDTDEAVHSVKGVSDMKYDLAIMDEAGDTVLYYADFSQVPETITLLNGKYKAACASENYYTNQSTFDGPSFWGAQDFEIKPRGTTSVNIVLTIAEVKVSVEYTDNFKQLISVYSTKILSDLGHELDFSSDETRSGYVRVGQSLDYKLTFLDNFDQTVVRTKTYTGLQPADYLKIKFDVLPPAEGDPNANVRIMIDLTLNAVRHTYEFFLDAGNPPTIEAVNFDPSKEILIEKGVIPYSKLKLYSEYGIVGVTIKCHTSFFNDSNLPKAVNLIMANETDKALLLNMGLVFSDDATGGYPVSGTKNNLTLDFQKFTDRIPAGLHTLEISVLSARQNEVSLPLVFNMSGSPIKTKTVSVTDTFRSSDNTNKVQLYGYWTCAEVPEGLTFAYRKNNETDWTILDPALITVNELTKEFSFDAFLPEKSGLVMKAVSYVADEMVGEGDEVAFQTREIQRIPNLSFDTWSQSGKNWYPNADASNSYWASGNEGVTMALVGKNANTVPEDNIIVRGRAVRLESISVPVVNFAAGNLFMGSYSTNISDPAASVKFGRPFTGRPDQLKGYYYYLPKPYGGGMDKCHIYIQLENRSNGTVIVGYAELKDDRTMSGYEPFTLDIVYRSNLPVTHAHVVATSSHEGGSFNGGVGSLLYVDEFEIVYTGK